MERRLMGLMEMPEVAREPFEDCPRFEKCSVNKCPLSTRYAFLTEVGPDIDDLGRPIEGTGDPERRCMLRRRKREEISAKYPGLLPNGGLTDEEIARDRRRARERAKWEALSPEKKALILSKLLAQKKELD